MIVINVQSSIKVHPNSPWSCSRPPLGAGTARSRRRQGRICTPRRCPRHCPRRPRRWCRTKTFGGTTADCSSHSPPHLHPHAHPLGWYLVQQVRLRAHPQQRFFVPTMEDFATAASSDAMAMLHLAVAEADKGKPARTQPQA